MSFFPSDSSLLFAVGDPGFPPARELPRPVWHNGFGLDPWTVNCQLIKKQQMEHGCTEIKMKNRTDQMSQNGIANLSTSENGTLQGNASLSGSNRNEIAIKNAAVVKVMYAPPVFIRLAEEKNEVRKIRRELANKERLAKKWDMDNLSSTGIIEDDFERLVDVGDVCLKNKVNEMEIMMRRYAKEDLDCIKARSMRDFRLVWKHGLFEMGSAFEFILWLKMQGIDERLLSKNGELRVLDATGGVSGLSEAILYQKNGEEYVLAHWYLLM